MKILLECDATGMDRAAILDYQGIEIDDNSKLSQQQKTTIIMAGMQLAAQATEDFTHGYISAQELFDDMIEAYVKHTEKKEP